MNISIMKTLYLFLMVVATSCMSYGTSQAQQKENGWYYILDGQKDSISKDPIVTVKEFNALELESDAFGVPVIFGTISKHRLKKWADATEKAIGKRIGFIYNDSVITAPQVNMRIESGRFCISSAPHKHNLKAIFSQIKQEKIDSIDSLFKNWNKDSIYYTLSKEKADSMIMAIDYWEAYAWKDLTTNPNEHYWYSIDDTTEYKKLEKELFEELQKPNLSSHSKEYMKSDAYKNYKAYICNNYEYINLMFQSFLFKNTKGLNGYLIDDIIQTKYPEIPSIRTFVDKTDNEDDELFAINEYQKKVWFQMNNEQRKREHEK